jgi:tRNA (guanine37-N1)-methyltransferase
MQIDIVSIFPDMFPGVLGASMVKRAQEGGLARITVHNLRDYTHDKRRTVDDRPYGGGPGMIMKPEPIFAAVETIRAGRCRTHGAGPEGTCQTILLSPGGEPFSMPLARELTQARHLILVCGRYEGVDERVRVGLADRLISIGDYVLTGGELPAMVLIDGVVRLIPGVIGHERATEDESFAEGWLEYPQFTRPVVFRNMRVPEVLRSGDHGRIARWRKLRAVEQTLAHRPDLARRHGAAGQGASPSAAGRGEGARQRKGKTWSG